MLQPFMDCFYVLTETFFILPSDHILCIIFHFYAQHLNEDMEKHGTQGHGNFFKIAEI